MTNIFDNVAKHQISAKRATENIIPPKDMEKIIRNVFQDLARMIGCTIGPAGGNTLVTEPYASTPIFPTKDGFRVMNNHIYDNPAYESIYRIVRDISGRMNEMVGDSTTSGIIVACSFYKSIVKYLKHHKQVTPYGAGNLLNVTLAELEKALKKHDYIKDISGIDKSARVSIYRKVATVSANNDSDIGNKVAGVYNDCKSEYAFIDIQQSNNESDFIETNLGFEIPYGFTHNHMATNADGITAEYDDPLFLLIDGPLLDPDLDNLKNYVKWVTEDLDNPRPLVIIAGEYSKKVMDYFTEVRVGVVRTLRNGQQIIVKLPVLSITFNMMNEMGVARIQDLEAILGAKALQTNNGRLQSCPDNPMVLLQMLGRADHIITRYAYTRIRGGGGSESERKGRIDEIQKIINNEKDVEQHGTLAMARIENLKRRIAMLQGEMSVIKVGGDSYKGKKNRALIYEDAVMATKACRDHGVTLGGQVSISHCINKYKDEIAENILAATKNDNDNPVNVIIGSNDKELLKIIKEVLDIIADSSQAAFHRVFENASNNKRWIKNVFKRFKNSDIPLTYNLISNKFEQFGDVAANNYYPNLIVPGNTDIELLKSVFAIVTLFVTSNQLISLLPKPKQA